MTKNTAKIKAGIKALSEHPNEIISGTVVPGSVDTTGFTMSVQLTDNSAPIAGVMLNSVTENSNGLILFPKDGSNVIVGSIDGPGEWALIRASEITKAIITIENVTYEMDSAQVNVKNGTSVFNVGTSVFKMNTASESLFQLLNDLITGITLLTVGTGMGPSTVPINTATFSSLLTRLNNLLSA
jgi:hypothetical protein